MSNTIVQYVLLRSDLLKELGWSVGALVAQACHASTAVLHLYKDDEQTMQYLSDLDNMHKVVLEVSKFQNKIANEKKLLRTLLILNHIDQKYFVSFWLSPEMDQRFSQEELNDLES